MSTPTLDAYRAANPGDHRTDGEIVPDLINRLQGEGTLDQFPDLIHAQTGVPETKPVLGNELIRGAASGLHSGEAKIFSTLAQVGDITGNEGLKNWGMEKYNQKMQKAAVFSPSVGSLSQIHSPMDAVRYGLGFAGSSIPQLGGLAAAGTVGGLVGGPIGAAVGAGGAMYSQSQDYGELINQGAQNPAAISAGVGLLGAALQAYVPGKVLGKIFGNSAGEGASAAVNAVLTKAETSLPGLGAYLMKGAAKEGGVFSAASVATELATMAGENYANRDNPNYTPPSSDEVKNRLLESGATGALLGGAFGAAGGIGEQAADKTALAKGLILRSQAEANAAAMHDAYLESASLTPAGGPPAVPPGETYLGELPPEQASAPAPIPQPVTPPPTEASPLTEEAGTPPTPKFFTADEPEEPVTPPAPEPQEPNWVTDMQTGLQANPWMKSLGKPDDLINYLQQVNPDLARRAAVGQASDAEVAAAVNPPAPPTQNVLPPETPGTPIAPPPPIEEPPQVSRPAVPEPVPAPPLSGTDTAPGNAANWLPPASVPEERTPEASPPDALAQWRDQSRSAYTKAESEMEAWGRAGRPYSPDWMARLGVKTPVELGMLAHDSGVMGSVAWDSSVSKIATKLTPPKTQSVKDGETLERIHVLKREIANKNTPPAIKEGMTLELQKKEALLSHLTPELPVFTTKPIQNVYPELRLPATMLQPGAGVGDISRVASTNLRQDETSVNLSKKLLAVHDAESNTIKLLPLWRSSGDRWRTALTLEDPVQVKKQIAEKLGITAKALDERLQDPGSRGDIVRRAFGDISSRIQKDPFIDELLDQKSGDKRRYTPLAVMDTMEAIKRRVFEFTDPDEFRRQGEQMQAKLLPERTLGGHSAEDATVAKLTKIAPDHASLVQVLASVIESEREKIPSLAKAGEADAIKKLLRIPQASEISEKLGAARRAQDLLGKFGPTGKPGKWLGLFDDDDIDTAWTLVKNPDLIKDLGGANQRENLTILFKALAQGAGFPDWKDYLVKASSLLGEKERGSALGEDATGDAKPAKAKGVEAHEAQVGGGKGAIVEEDKPISRVVKFDKKFGDASIGGMTLDELGDLGRVLREGVMDKDGEEEPGLERHLGTDIRLAREDSDLSGPDSDDEFNDVKGDLREFITHIWQRTRGIDSSMLSDAELYKIWSVLDRVAKNTMPAKDDYRETNHEISERYRATVSTLVGTGTDVNLIEQNLDAQAHLLSQEMEQVQFVDGRRILIQTMSDIENPSMENLRTTLHGAAHILFYGESASVRALLLDAVDRMTQLKLDVFSKTRDARIAENSPLSGSVLAEEVLAEHMSYFGLKQKFARDIATRFISALKQIYNRGAILWSQLSGYALDPKIAQDYVERRMSEFVDKTLTSTADLDVMTGNVRDLAHKTIQLFKSSDSQYYRSDYDPISGNTVFRDVIPIGKMETLFNLDNRLQFHEAGIPDPAGTKATMNYFRDRFLITENPTDLNSVLDKVLEAHGDEDGVKHIVNGIKQNIPEMLDNVTIRFASADDELKKLDNPGGEGASSAIYNGKRNEIWINPKMEVPYTSLGAAKLILHEAMHIGTSEAANIFRRFKSLGHDIDALMTIMPGKDPRSIELLMRHVEKISDIYDHLSGKGFYPGAYGMTNMSEFMSEAFANRMFQIKLSREMLPNKLVSPGTPRSAFQNLIHWMARIWQFNHNEKGNALVETVKGVEKIMRVADGSAIGPNPTDEIARGPISEKDSDALVKRDYEYNYAVHNSWIDLLNGRIGPLAKRTGISVADYMDRIFGVKDPNEGRAALDQSADARIRPIPLNKDLRLSDVAGKQNQLQPGSDRVQIQAQVLGRAREALMKLDEIHDDMTRRTPRFEEILKQKQESFSKWDQKLNDLMAIRDDVTKNLRAQIGSLRRNLRDATFWSTEHHGLAGVAADLFGVKGGYGLPSDVVKLITDGIEEAGHSDHITNLLAAFEQFGMNVAGRTPSDIEADLQAKYQSGKDARLQPFIDGTPKAKADLASAIFLAKTDPENTMLLGIRSEKDMALKQLLVQELKNSTRKATVDTADLPALMKLSDQKRARVLSVRRTTNKYRSSLEDASDALKHAKLVTQEAGVARQALQDGIAGMDAERGVQASPFQPAQGAPLITTPDPKGKAILPSGENPTRLSLLQKDQPTLRRLIWDNKEWLDQHQGVGGPEYAAVQSQYNALKGVAGGYFQSNVNRSLYAQIFESIGTRLRYTGNPTAKIIADRIDRYVNVDRSAEKLTFKGPVVTQALGKTLQSWGFDKNYEGFIRTVFNPTCHFLEHFPSKEGEEGTMAAKKALQTFLMGKDTTAKYMRENPAAFEDLWDFYHKNLDANHGVAEFARSSVNKQPVLVKDPSIPIKDPFTGKVGPSYRCAMDTGYGTTQRDVSPIFELKRTLDSVKSMDGTSIWPGLPKKSEGPITPQMEKAMFTPEVIDKFVRPYMSDVGTLHFPSPRMADGDSYNRANPVNVQQAWALGNSDLRQFSDGLYGREVSLQPSPGGMDEYHQDILRFFTGEYSKIANMTEGQENFDKRGFGQYFISSNMMDTRKAEDFPPEFTKYRIYDHISLMQMIQNIAAHGTMGRDLGFFDGANDRNHGIAWEFHNAINEIEADQNSLKAARSTILMEDPHLATKEVEAKLKAQFGDQEYKRLNNLSYAKAEIQKAEQNLYGYLASPNGSSRQFSAGLTTLRTVVDAMLNNPRSVLTSMNRMIDPFMTFGAGPLGRSAVKGSIESFGRSAAGSIVQAFAGQAKLASEYDHFVHNSGIGLDRANFITPAQIIADTGKNNAYEEQKYLATVRKGRDLVFNTGWKPQDEEERIAPALRPHAPYSMFSESMDQGLMSDQARIYNTLFKSAVQHFRDNPEDANNPAFEFSKESLNANMPMALSDDNVGWFKHQLGVMGTTLELEARDLYRQEKAGGDLGGIIIPKHLGPLIASQALSEIALASDINKGPAWLYNTKFGRVVMPLMTWSTLKMNQVVGGAHTLEGDLTWKRGKLLMLTMAAGVLPASVLIGMIIDQYDEHVIGKKSNMEGYNWDSPSQTAAALMERTARIGTFGLAGDIANGLRVYGSDGDTRGISFDQRVVFMNTIMSTLSLMNTAFHQNGELTYDTFWRPLLNTVGGNSILQYGQIMNRVAVGMGGSPVLQSEYEETTKINALNYLRAAGRATDVAIKQGSGDSYTSTPMHPYISSMVLSAYSNDIAGFQDAYQKALKEARDEGNDDPEEVVKRSFASYHPLRYVFQSEPTPSQVSRIMMTMSDKGREDVSSAIQSYDQFASLLGIRTPDRPKAVASRSKPKAFGSF